MSEHTADIADVFRDAVRVTASELQAGDSVFGSFGRLYELTRVTHAPKRVTTTREDGVRDIWLPGDTLTIVKGAK